MTQLATETTNPRNLVGWNPNLRNKLEYEIFRAKENQYLTFKFGTYTFLTEDAENFLKKR